MIRQGSGVPAAARCEGREFRIAARCSNPCTLRLSWTLASAQALGCTEPASRDVPVVCIQMRSLIPTGHPADDIMPGGRARQR